MTQLWVEETVAAEVSGQVNISTLEPSDKAHPQLGSRKAFPGMLRFPCGLAKLGRNVKPWTVMPVQGQHCSFSLKLQIIPILGTNA